MPFSKALARSEIQIASSTIWTRFTDFISSNENRYTKRASTKEAIIHLLWIMKYVDLKSSQ